MFGIEPSHTWRPIARVDEAFANICDSALWHLFSCSESTFVKQARRWSISRRTIKATRGNISGLKAIWCHKNRRKVETRLSLARFFFHRSGFLLDFLIVPSIIGFFTVSRSALFSWIFYFNLFYCSFLFLLFRFSIAFFVFFSSLLQFFSFSKN